MKTRICIKCQQELPLEEFTKDPSRKEGRRNECHKCKNYYYREKRVGRQLERARIKSEFEKQFPIATESELAYMAGIVDGEGSMVARHYWAPRSKNPSVICRVRVYNTNKKLIDWIAKRWPGIVYPRPKVAHQKMVWAWETKALRARNLILKLLPYLIIKKRQAEILIELIPFLSRPEDNYKGIPVENLAKRKVLVDEIKALNVRGDTT